MMAKVLSFVLAGAVSSVSKGAIAGVSSPLVLPAGGKSCLAAIFGACGEDVV